MTNNEAVWKHIVIERTMKDTKLEQQLKDWQTLHALFSDAQKLPRDKQREFLDNEVYPLLKDYVNTYKIKYDHLTRPR